MDNKIKVSIVVPTYNVEQYLEECLESIKRQTLKDIEIICVNDGSTDNSLELLKKIAEDDDRFVIIDKENGGYGMAMNVGMAKAKGEYIGIVEPDDFVKFTMYEDLYKIAKENDLDFVKADFYRFTTDPKNQDRHFIYNHLDGLNLYYNQVLNPSEMPDLIKLIMNTWSGIYKREFLQAHNIKHNETPGASFQDNGFFWQTFIYAKRAMFLNKPYYRNRRDNPNSSVRDKCKVYAMNIEYDFIREILMQNGNEELWERFKGYYHFKKFSNYMFTLNRIADEYKREYVDRISKEFSRARDLEELNFSIFTFNESEKLKLLIEQPDMYYSKYVQKTCDEISKYKHTQTFFDILHTARIDIKLENPNTPNSKAEVKVENPKDKYNITTPDWFQKNGVGYVVECTDYEMVVSVKCLNDGKLKIALLIKDMKLNGVRIPLLIDYTDLFINDKMIFFGLKPCSHDKPFKYEIDARKGNEYKIKLRWKVHGGGKEYDGIVHQLMELIK